MKLTLNHVLDWMQENDPDIPFADLKDLALNQKTLESLCRVVELWKAHYEIGSDRRRVCLLMLQALHLEWAAAAKPTRTGKIAAMLSMCPQGHVWSMPIFFTDGTVTTRVESFSYNASSDALRLNCQMRGQNVFLNDDTDFVAGFYYDGDYPDGYLLVEPEWYSKLGG